MDGPPALLEPAASWSTVAKEQPSCATDTPHNAIIFALDAVTRCTSADSLGWKKCMGRGGGREREWGERENG